MLVYFTPRNDICYFVFVTVRQNKGQFSGNSVNVREIDLYALIILISSANIVNFRDYNIERRIVGMKNNVLIN